MRVVVERGVVVGGGVMFAESFRRRFNFRANLFLICLAAFLSRWAGLSSPCAVTNARTPRRSADNSATCKKQKRKSTLLGTNAQTYATHVICKCGYSSLRLIIKVACPLQFTGIHALFIIIFIINSSQSISITSRIIPSY